MLEPKIIGKNHEIVIKKYKVNYLFVLKVFTFLLFVMESILFLLLVESK